MGRKQRGSAHARIREEHENLIKTDASGVALWNKEFGGGSSANTGNSVYQTTDGGYVSTGTTLLGENSMILLIKTDENGDLIPD